MNYILGLLENDVFDGFYVEGIHNVFPTNCITIDVQLYEYLLDVGVFRLLAEKEDKVYTLDDKEKFEKINSIDGI
ncbi:hypothetical protein [Romboutsia sp.]|uniref:hypothetical protein n=1 Tax=Romboutsia sp. TaxID=1965302 RepID=UPI002C92879C|nr:hypothetical protein [Romboutsia sp.]HSQ90160.1 hypothetical protein [Romboutsia sp.]